MNVSIDWLQKALKMLSMDELQRVMSKVEKYYKSAFKVINVNRSETKTQVTVELATSHERKLVVL